MDAATIIHTFILAVLVPAWLLVGFADWWCHRQSSIETTSGVRESFFHLLLSTEAAVAVIPAMLFDINGLILVVMLVAFVAHEITTTIDFHIAAPLRLVTPREQRVHDYLTAIPFAALCLVFATHTGDAAAVLGIGGAPADFALRWKDPALPTAYLVAWVAASACLNVLPFAEEFVRGLKVAWRSPVD